jgi:alkylhydroperoxidase/carboxymuconolactone decarboxylase family protein YurZ
MSLLKLIDEASATGKVKAVFDDIKETKGIECVPNIWRALANHPDHLEVTWNKLKTIMRPGKLDLLTKEIIALAVSITNNCEY